MAKKDDALPEIPLSFSMPPQTRLQTVKSILKLIIPLFWIIKAFSFFMNTLFGKMVGRQIIRTPYETCRSCGNIVPELHSDTQLSNIHEYALQLNEQEKWGYKTDHLPEKTQLHHAYLKTHDNALIEHSCIAPKKWLNPEGQLQNIADVRVVCAFTGRTRSHLHELPLMLLRSHDMDCVYTSFTNRGLRTLKKTDDQQEVSYYRQLLGLTARNETGRYITRSQRIIDFFKKMRVKSIERSEDLISDGMAFVGHYLKQGLRPSQITLDAFSMGGLGVKVADRYRKIFKRFQTPHWHKNKKLLNYAQKLFGIEDTETLMTHLKRCTQEGFEFNVWADRTFSTLTRVVLGRVRVALDLAKWPRFGTLVFAILLPFCDVLLGLMKWRSSILKSILKLNPKLISIVAIESPIDPNTGKLQYESDTMVHFKGASLYQRLLDVGQIRIWKKLYEWLWIFEQKDLLRSHSPEANLDRQKDLNHYRKKAEDAHEQRLVYPHDEVDNILNGRYAHAACRETLVLYRGRAEKKDGKPYTLQHLFKKFVQDCDKNRGIIRKEQETITRQRTLQRSISS